MSHSYRISRNIEKSILTWLTEKLEDSEWDGIRIEKTFVDAYRKSQDGSPLLPCIVVNVLETRLKRLEIGGKSYLKYITVNIRIFGTSDGNRLDLADFIIDLLEDDIPYYTYEIVDNNPSGTEAGKIAITKIFEDKKEMVNSEPLVLADKFRHIITVEVMVSLS